MGIVLDGLTIDGTTGEIIGLPDNGRDSARYAWSDGDLAYSVPAYAAAWNGGRPVQNEADATEDLTNAVWSKTNGTATSTIFTATGANATCLQTLTKTASDRIYACSISRVTGTGTVEITTDGGTTWAGVTSSITGTLQRFSVSKAAEANPVFGARLGTSGDEITFTYHSNEDATGRADTTTPSEYVENGTGNGYAVYGTENGNSVADGTQGETELVTNGRFLDGSTGWTDQATGTGSVTFYSGKVNITGTSSANRGIIRQDITNVPSGTTIILDIHPAVASGFIYGGTNLSGTFPPSDQFAGGTALTGGRYTLTTTEVADYLFFWTGSTGGNADIYFISVKEYTAVNDTKVVTEGVGAALSPVSRLSHNPALTNSQTYSNDQSNAVYTATNVTVGAQDEIGLRGYLNTACTLTASAANGTVIADAVTAAAANQVTRWFLKRKTGTGTIEITTDNGGTWTDVTSGITTAFSEVLAEKAAVTNPQIGIRIATSADAVIVGNAELHTDTNLENVRGCGPIFTTTTAISTTADDYSYDIANHSDTGLTYACEWTPGYSASEATGDQEIITLGTAPDMLYHDATGGAIESTDGTNTSTKAETITADTTYDLEVAYSTGSDSLQVSVDGVVGSSVAYDDAFPTGTKISLFRNSSYPQEMFAFTITEPDATSIPVFAHHYMHNIG